MFQLSKYHTSIINWRKSHLTDSGFLLLLAIIIGLLSGAAAGMLKYLIKFITSGVSTGIKAIGPDWLIILVPVAGVLLTVIFCRYVLRDKVDNGVARMVSDLKNSKYSLRGDTIYGSMIASALTLGFGGTAGSEGPIAYAGAGIGSKIGRAFGLSPQLMMTLIGCGAAAGIAGIFKAPIGGALFTLEVLRVELTTVSILSVFLATLTASLTAYILSGYTLDINVISPGAYDTSTILWTILLGAVCGLYSLYYTYTGDQANRLLKLTHNVWFKGSLSGLAIGLMIFMFPSLYGEGYGTITDIINGTTRDVVNNTISSGITNPTLCIIVTCLGILLLKGVGSSVTNNGGGVAGDFAPTLYAGCILGVLYATTLHYFNIAELDTAHYALIAMAGAMSGIIRAPIMALFLTTEMIGGVDFLLPATIVSLISYWIVMLFKHDTFYHSSRFGQSQLNS